jgi:hypothetical protein
MRKAVSLSGTVEAVSRRITSKLCISSLDRLCGGEFFNSPLYARASRQTLLTGAAERLMLVLRAAIILRSLLVRTIDRAFAINVISAAARGFRVSSPTGRSNESLLRSL